MKKLVLVIGFLLILMVGSVSALNFITFSGSTQDIKKVEIPEWCRLEDCVAYINMTVSYTTSDSNSVTLSGYGGFLWSAYDWGIGNLYFPLRLPSHFGEVYFEDPYFILRDENGTVLLASLVEFSENDYYYYYANVSEPYCQLLYTSKLTALTLQDNAYEGYLRIGFKGCNLSFNGTGYNFSYSDAFVEFYGYPTSRRYEERISYIEYALHFIEQQLERVKQWLFFWEHQGEEENICNAIENECVPPQIECYSDSDCSPDEWIGNPYCSDGGVFRNFRNWYCENPGTQQSYCSYTDTPTLIQDCVYGCENGACLQRVRRVLVRTNVVQGNGENYNRGITSDGLGAWIAFDMDGNGSLEGYGKTSGAIMSGCKAEGIGATPDGFKMINDSVGNLGVCYSNTTTNARKYSTIDSDAKNAVLNPEPTEPYASRGQELYEFIGTDESGGGGGGGGGGAGVNVSVDVEWGTS